MDFVLLGELLVLLTVANGAPVVMTKLLKNRMSWPLDAGARFLDGRPLFGASKTIRGLLSSLLLTTLASRLMGFGYGFGAIMAVASMGGDLFSSFVKRRLNLPPSSMAIGLDQIPESLAPLVAVRLMAPLTALDIVVATAIFFVGELLLSRLLYQLNIREKPY
jgi:CDP-2,3-bis-(O-geranylgeranyl)-sn-glycerol synthase